jgi:MFS family permease
MNTTPYSGFRWYIFFTMIIVTATTSMALIAPASLFGPRLFGGAMPGLSPGQIIWASMGIFNFFLGIAALLAGPLLDKFGPIKTFIGGLLLVMAGAILMPICGSSYWGMIFIRLLQGAGTGPIMASAVPIAAAYFPENERSIVTGAQGFSVALGIIVGLQWVPRLAYSYGDSFVAMRVLAFVGIVGLLLSFVAAFGPKASQDTTGALAGDRDTPDYFKQALVNPMTWVAILCFTLMSGIFQQFNSLVVPYINSPTIAEAGRVVGLGIDPNGMFAQNTLTFATLAFCLGSFIGGFVTEKLFGGKGRPVIAIGFLVGAILALTTKYEFITSNQDVLRITLITTAFFFSMVNPQTQSYLAKNYPKEIGGKLGGLTMFVGIVIGSTLAVKWLELSVDNTLSYMQPITIMAGLSFTGFFLALFLKPKPT